MAETEPEPPGLPYGPRSLRLLSSPLVWLVLPLPCLFCLSFQTVPRTAARIGYGKLRGQDSRRCYLTLPRTHAQQTCRGADTDTAGHAGDGPTHGRTVSHHKNRHSLFLSLYPRAPYRSKSRPTRISNTYKKRVTAKVHNTRVDLTDINIDSAAAAPDILFSLSCSQIRSVIRNPKHIEQSKRRLPP
ncbi:hypothetical protein TgHK011_004694 [Trichoderma gracile]|nr:hypothetical protein TgHK011_004694 [Trichoderma gracile]